MVNALGHRYGYRNFDTNDNSRNHTLTALLVVGEGYQNNHHESPHSANFAVKKGEIDTGYWMCLLAEKFGLVQMN